MHSRGPCFPLLLSDRLIDEMKKVGMTSKAAANTIRHEKTFSGKSSLKSKRKRPVLYREARANLHLEGTAAGDELARQRLKLLAEKGN